MNKRAIIPIIVLAVVLLAALSYASYEFVKNKPIYANLSNLSNNSYYAYECLDDSDCDFDQICFNNTCKSLILGYCSYIQEHRTVRFECCQDSDCPFDRRCSSLNNTCELIKCKLNEGILNYTCKQCEECQYLQNQQCINYECCANEECAPNYFCENHSCTRMDCTNDNECPKDNITVTINEGESIRLSANYTLKITSISTASGSNAAYISVNNTIAERLAEGNTTIINNLIIYAKSIEYLAKSSGMISGATLEITTQKCLKFRCLNFSNYSSS